MTRPDLENLPEVSVPDGYSLVTAEQFDSPEAMWAALINKAFGDTNWTAEYVCENYTSKEQYDPGGAFFVMHSDAAVSTAFAWLDEPGETQVGRIHWVGTDPEHRRKGLASVVCVSILRYFRDRGFRQVFLETHPPLIPAIRAYLALGLEPTPRNDEEEQAWDEVLAKVRERA